MRSGPGISYTRIGTAPNGATVTIISYDSSWSKIKYGGTTGYVSTKYLKMN
ncbi:MAG: SH3 domain-containing protein [Eubacteriales bacterium]